MNRQSDYGDPLRTRNPHIRHADQHPVSEIEWARIRHRNRQPAALREHTGQAGSPPYRPAGRTVGVLSQIHSHGTGVRRT